MHIGVIGINHKSADIALREKIARKVECLSDSRAIFLQIPVVLLSTCNRTEVYFSADDLAEAHTCILAYLRSLIDVAFDYKMYSYFYTECFAHLCRVTAGLDSAVMGESEIQGQVKLAYGQAAHVFSLPHSMHYAFQKALQWGKYIRSLWEKERVVRPTLFNTIWQLAETCKKNNILLVGNSAINRGFISFLLHKGFERFVLCTKTPKAPYMTDRSILQEWPKFDLIICASRAEQYLISGEGRNDTYIFDLSVPRNVDPLVGKSAVLYNIEQIHHFLGKKHIAPTLDATMVWEYAVRTVRSFEVKTRRDLESEGKESRLGYFPSR